MGVDRLDTFWAASPEAILGALSTSADRGLSAAEAASRRARYGPNLLHAAPKRSDLRIFLGQFTNPIVLILLAAAVLSLFLGDRPSAAIILVIVLASGALGFWQEYFATDAVAKLLAIVQVHTTVLRDGQRVDIPVTEVVPGDILILSAGDAIPGDALLLVSKELHVDESTLTGEAFPVEKQPAPTPPETPLGKRSGVLFMGTHVVSGSASAVVVRTGTATEFGKVSQRLGRRPEETDFERGIRRFGNFLAQVALALVLAIFGINVYLHKPVVDSFLFSLALAIGITPQLLPAVVSINLAHGARTMANVKVIAKKLTAIENFGSMTVLCSDKTGTLTEGVVHLKQALDARGQDSADVHRWAYLNSHFQAGFANPIDAAIRKSADLDSSGWRKLDEEPYDFVRRRLSVLLEHDGQRVLVTKGALTKVLEVCTQVRLPDGASQPIGAVAESVHALYSDLSAQGYRTLGVAVREGVSEERIDKTAEHEMAFVGLLVLFDPPKVDAKAAVEELARRGVTFKIITGDNALVAATSCRLLGLVSARVLTGSEVGHLTGLALARLAPQVDVFAEVEPHQKEDIIRALQAAGEVVGYLGDGINDASALHVADVGISVNTAVDVAKEAAAIVLLEKDLSVLARGIQEGRTTFANTLKYVFMATSGNFGNMISMAGASLFLPFLPLLPTQILLGNLLTDFPAMTISTDSVDPELVAKPRRWDVKFIRNFMLAFGPINSAMDYLTFGILLLVLRVGEVGFHTGWFLENVFTAALIVLVIRTRRPFWQSRPGRWLVVATVGVLAVTLALPFTPLGPFLGFEPIPVSFVAMLAAIMVVYIFLAEVTKRMFYRHAQSGRTA
ncbi:MAG TPA: magnesium-translocating P-type ATPase [bacterium]